MRAQTQTRGFSLIELLIVVAIIGILASIAIPNFILFQCRTKRSEAVSILGGIRTFELVYFQEHEEYFVDGTDLVAAGFEYSRIMYNIVTFTGGSGPPPWFLAEVKSSWTGPGGQDHWTINDRGTLISVNNGCQL